MRRSVNLFCKILDPHRLHGFSQLETEHLAVEIQLGVQGTLDVLRLAEAVLLTFEGDVGDRQALGFDRREHGLGLAGRDDLIFQALEEDHRAGDLVDEVDGGALVIQVFVFRVGTDQVVEVARFELVGIVDEGGQVANAVMAGASLEDLAEGEGTKSGVAPGAATADGQALRVDQPLTGQVERPVTAVVDIHHAPVAIQALAVGAAIAADGPGRAPRYSSRRHPPRPSCHSGAGGRRGHSRYCHRN
jgi:hypothetical protein